MHLNEVRSNCRHLIVINLNEVRSNCRHLIVITQCQSQSRRIGIKGMSAGGMGKSRNLLAAAQARF